MTAQPNPEKAAGHETHEVLDAAPKYRCECGVRVDSIAGLIAHVAIARGGCPPPPWWSRSKAQQRRDRDPCSGLPWTPAEDRRLLRAVDRMESRPVKPWQHAPRVDWGKIATSHQRSILAVRGRVSILRAAARLAHGIGARTK